MQQLKNWSATNFTSEERLIEAPEDMYIAVVDGYIENKSSNTNTISFKVYTYEDQEKFSIDYKISEGRKRNLTTKMFLQNREYLSIETSNGEADVVLFGSEAPVSELDPPKAWEWMGEWDSTVTYHPNNLVRAKDGNIYKAEKTSQGDVPYEDNDSWRLFIANMGTWQGEWDDDLTYYPSDVVRANDGNLYRAKNETTRDPTKDTRDWEILLKTFGDWRGDWESDKQYYTNDIVKAPNGNLYIALVPNEGSEPSDDNNDWDLLLERSDSDANSIQGESITDDSPKDGHYLVYDDSSKEFVYRSSSLNRLLAEQYTDEEVEKVQSNLDDHTSDDSIHRIIDDDSTSSEDLWSAAKIDEEVNTVQTNLEEHDESTGDVHGVPEDENVEWQASAKTKADMAQYKAEQYVDEQFEDGVTDTYDISEITSITVEKGLIVDVE